jgi:hypothetical protein
MVMSFAAVHFVTFDRMLNTMTMNIALLIRNPRGLLHENQNMKPHWSCTIPLAAGQSQHFVV